MKALSKSILLVLLIAGTVATSATLFESYLYEYKGSSVVKLTMTYEGRSGGTGFQIKAPSGKQYTLTNAHICRIGDSLIAHAQNGVKKKIRVIKIYDKHDLCIMEPVAGLRSLKIADNIELHERVWLIGHPALRDLTLESGHFVGNANIRIITECKTKPNQKEIDRLMKKRNPTIKDIIKLFQLMANLCTKRMTSQHINNISYGGNSGSPVVNKWGNVVGVLYAGRRDQNTASHTVPIKEIHKFLKDK